MNKIKNTLIITISLIFIGCIKPDEDVISFPSRIGFINDSAIVAYILKENGIDPTSQPDSVYRSGYPHTYNITFDTYYNSETGRLQSLRMLGLGLTVIPPQIALLDSLKFLDISHNNITNLPDEITFLYLSDSSLILHDNKMSSQNERISDWINKYICEDWLNRQYTNVTDSYEKDTNVIRHILDASGFDAVGVKLVTHIRSSRLFGFSWPYYAKQITLNGEWGPVRAFQPITNRIVYADSLSKCDELILLELNGAQLGEIPPDIYNMLNIQSLQLAGNGLVTIDDKICNLKNLEYLNLANNQLTDLPLCITTLPNIKFMAYKNLDSFCGNYLSPHSKEIIDWLNLFGIDYWKACQRSTIPLEKARL